MSRKLVLVQGKGDDSQPDGESAYLSVLGNYDAASVESYGAVRQKQEAPLCSWLGTLSKEDT